MTSPAPEVRLFPSEGRQLVIIYPNDPGYPVVKVRSYTESLVGVLASSGRAQGPILPTLLRNTPSSLAPRRRGHAPTQLRAALGRVDPVVHALLEQVGIGVGEIRSGGCHHQLLEVKQAVARNRAATHRVVMAGRNGA